MRNTQGTRDRLPARTRVGFTAQLLIKEKERECSIGQPPRRIALTARGAQWRQSRSPTSVGVQSTRRCVGNEIVHDWDAVQQQYRDERRDLFNRVLREIPAKELAKAARISERSIKAIRNAHARPSAKTRNLLLRAAKRFQL
jgi:hypothetical protein